MRNLRVVAVVSLISFAPSAFQPSKMNQPKPPSRLAKPPRRAKAGQGGEPEKPKEEPPVVTHHEIHVGGRVLHYTATTGYMPIRNDEGTDIEANIFFIAYTLDNPPAKRPLMFSFNGGPGSASIWLHLGNRTAPRQNASQWRHAPAALRADRQRRHLARPDRPRIHRSRRHRLQSRHQERTRQEILWRER